MSLDRYLQEVTAQDIATPAEGHALVVGGKDGSGLVTQVLTDATGKVIVSGGAANIPTIDASDGSLNATAPLYASQVGGQDGTGKLQVFKVDNSGNLNVNLAAGSISGGNAAASATGSAVPASADYLGVNIAGNLVGVTGHSLTNAKAADVAIVDGSGNQITSFGGGTQFADNAASGATPTGTLTMAWDSANSKVRALKVDASQNLAVSGSISNTGFTVTPATSGGTSNYHAVAAGTNNAASIKGTAGQVYGFTVFNNAAYPVFVKLYNKATAPAPATDNALLIRTIGVQAGTHVNYYNVSGIAGFASGIGIAIVKGIGDTDNTSVVASDCVVDVDYK